MSADDWVKIIGAGAGALVAVMTGLGALWVQVGRYHAAVNSKMDALLELTATASRAEGRLEGTTRVVGQEPP